MRAALAAAATLALVSCSPSEVSFPHQPPHRSTRDRPAPVNADELRALAEPGAMDCGVGVDVASRAQVYECAAQRLARRQPFFCRYAQPRSDVDVFSPSPIGAAPPWPMAFVGRTDGRVLGVVRTPAGEVVAGTNILDRREVPRHMQWGMAPPRLASNVHPKAGPALDGIGGIVIVETDIQMDGSVGKTRVIKALPLGADTLAEQLVHEVKFEPARVFGVPVAVSFNVTVRVEKRTLWIEGPR